VGALRALKRRLFNHSLKYLENLNKAGENATRLAVYRAMIETGDSRAAVAHRAKNVTVNFNRKGESGAEANALWLFFNASAQSAATVVDTMVNGKHRQQAWASSAPLMALVYGLSLLCRGGG
jgi:hypothetical protein